MTNNDKNMVSPSQNLPCWGLDICIKLTVRSQNWLCHIVEVRENWEGSQVFYWDTREENQKYKWLVLAMTGLPRWLSGKRPACHCRDMGLISELRRSCEGSRDWPPTPIFLARKSHGLEKPGRCCSPCGHRGVRQDWVTKQVETFRRWNTLDP